MIDKSEWEWFGRAGHFCCASWCRFHLCTKVGKYLVSTVGEYVHPRHGKGSEVEEEKWLRKNWPGEDIAIGRKYETMVFKAGKPCRTKKCGCGVPVINLSGLDFRGYMTAGEATKGHMELCEEWSKK